MVLPTPRCKCSGCNCNIGKQLNEVKENEKAYEFFMGLDEDFAVIRTQILAMNPTPSLGTIYHLVAENKQRRAITGGSKRSSVEASAFQANYNSQRGYQQHQGKKNTHVTNKTTQKATKSEHDKKEKCTFCQREGHNKEGCFKIVGYPEWWLGKKDKPRRKAACVEMVSSPIPGLTDEQYHLFVTHFKENGNMAGNENQPRANMAGARIIIRNGDKVPVMGEGEHTLPGGVKIKGVLFVPSFDYNLLSVNKLADDLNYVVTFFHGFFVIHELGMKHLIGAAKHTRLPFPTSEIKTLACFDLIHCDVWGKYRTPSMNKAYYFLTVVDDFSRDVWTFLLKHKHEASTFLIDFYKMVKTQFGVQIKRIRTEIGGEFVSNNMRDFYAQEVIVLETSCPHTPQQNGVVERKHRHLLETARALRFQANLPKTFWGEYVLTATYVINRMPSKILHGATPYEVLFKQKPSYEHMWVFDCLTYHRNIDTGGDKFEQRGKPGIFVGYPLGTKGYKIYDLESRK
uniref:Integrase catalytic domain-containing protein n=1 Tax=Lactuca sativa TaxID=4236 RepID=A0A9R1W0C9_LACSA|nr:hypothetical protein LSAT_V11C400195050 [Lactuca sativa]